MVSGQEYLFILTGFQIQNSPTYPFDMHKRSVMRPSVNRGPVLYPKRKHEICNV